MIFYKLKVLCLKLKLFISSHNLLVKTQHQIRDGLIYIKCVHRKSGNAKLQTLMFPVNDIAQKYEINMCDLF